MRALGGVGLGYFIGEWYKSNSEKIKSWSPSIVSRLCLSVFELCFVFFIINNLMFHKLDYKNQIVFVIIFALTVILFLLRKGVVSKFLNHEVWVILASYAYSLYMVHLPVIEILKGAIWKKHPELIYQYPFLSLLITFILILLLTVFAHKRVEIPVTKWLKNNVKI